jgi:hypothetical protein
MLPMSSGCESFDASTIRCSVQPSSNVGMGRFSYSRRGTDLELAPESATGAAMAARLRELDYPASHYLEAGTADTVIWPLQEVLPGGVPLRFSVGHAEQLLELAENSSCTVERS